MQHLKIYSKQDILSMTRVRRFETKLGEVIQALGNPQNIEQALENSSEKFVIAGIPEGIGVKANLGIGGADSAWIPFLQSFLNIQSNDFLQGNDLLLLGHFNFNDIETLIDSNAHSYEE